MRGLARSLVLIALAAPACAGEDTGEPELSTEELEVRRLAYDPIDLTEPPPGLAFWAPVGLSDDGAVYGQGFACDELGTCTLPAVERARDGTYRIVHPSFQVLDVDDQGNLGGCTIDDPATFFGRAAVLTRAGALHVFPALPGEVTACVGKLADDRVVVVDSFDEAFGLTTYVSDKGAVTPVPPDILVEDVNDRGQLAGIAFTPDGGRAVRFDADTATATTFEPIAGDPESWGQGINRHGEVLGYSFVSGGIERIGSWDRDGDFAVSFVEGTPEYPTVSNRLVWNEAGLIVISWSFGDPSTYLVPAPGTRVNLADLVGGAEVPPTLRALALNRGGDLLATSMADGRSVLYVRRP
jgi:hypothetical protein